jgi:transcriptional regulator with XRE-family HTH domain
MSTLSERFSYNAGLARTDRGLSQVRLATLMGEDRRIVGRLEHGGGVTLERAVAFARALDADLVALLDTEIGAELHLGCVREGVSTARVVANVIALREKRGFSQRELATRAAMHPNALSVFEKGEQAKMFLKTLERLAIALDVTPGSLL